MSLIKSFNFNFLKQNLKKSKGGIILSLIIVPLLMSIFLVVMGINNSSPEFISPEMFGIINMIFMYILPFIYSVALFGFVFRKSSTDFMNSIPINRKTMFVTNTIGGIILITIIHFLSAFFVLLWGAIFKNLIIFPMSIFETMLLSWISYIFVFISANLAMTFSGTTLTQLVVTILILFLVPASIEMIVGMNNFKEYSSMNYTESYDLSIIHGYQTTHYQLMEKIKNYTMPFKFFRYGLEFSWETIIRMSVLSIIYFYVGLKLYQKRKMEHNEESFGTVKLHVIVKALTLIPILLFANLINMDFDITFSIIVIILMAIYYFIFDLIVKRKIKMRISIISFVISIFVIQSSISFLKNINNNKPIDIDYEDIKSISLGINRKSKDSYFYGYYNEEELIFDGNHFIEDKELLDFILEEKEKKEKNNTNNYDYYGYSNKDLYFNIKLKSGKEYYMRIPFLASKYNKLIELVSKDEKYMKHIKKKLINQNGIYRLGNNILDSNTKNAIENEIKSNIESIDFNRKYDDNDIYFIDKAIYENNKIFYYKIPIDLSDEFMKIIARFSNNASKKSIRGYQYNLTWSVFDESGNVDMGFGNEELLDFIEDNVDNDFNPNNKYYIITGSLQTYDGYKSFRFFTNNIKDVDNMLKNSERENNYYFY